MADRVHESEEEYEEEDEYTDEEYSEEDEEEEEEDDEEEEEPKLKYQRLGASVVETLKKDSASCMAVHDKFLALGTRYGAVSILDFNGNENQRFACHSANINELSIDDNGEYIASCADDGKVVINALFQEGEPPQVHSFRRPVMCVALDPMFSKGAGHEFALGGRAGQLVLNKKGFMGFGSRAQVLHQGEGPIYALKWRGSLIAWANDRGVKIHDCRTGQRITYIDRPKGSPRPDLYRCNLCWESDDLLLIGWADSIKIGKVKERRNTSGGLPTRYVEIVAMIQTEYRICGIAPFGEYLVVLAYLEERNEKGEALRPELRIITRKNEKVSSDALTILGFEHYAATNYRLDHMASESLFYIVSPKDIVVAKPRDLDDHITWLLDHGQYEAALVAASANEAHIRTHKLIDIGEAYLAHLLDTGKVEAAAALCPRILGRDEKLWEKWIFRFAKLRQLKEISPYIPIANPTLSQTVYEVVLCYFLNHNHEGFLRTIQDWPHTLYNIQNIITAVLEQLKTVKDAFVLMDALAELYTFDKQFDKTLTIYLRLKRGNVFELIEKHDLYEAVQDKVKALIQFDPDEAVRLLVANTDRIPIATVVAQLNDEPYLQHLYLHALFLKMPHAASRFHELQIQLYADYDYKNLMPFLKQSNTYSLDKALELFQKRQFFREMVYILGRMGRNQQALELIIGKLGDVKLAIEFVTEQNDDALWDDLIEHSMENAQFVSGLLEHIGAHVDPLKLIKRIPNGVHIERLRDRLVKIISDYNLQMSLREGCNVILTADVVSLEEKLNRGQCRAMKVEQSARCAICTGQVIPAKERGGLVVFFCSHVYHQHCLQKAHIGGAEGKGQSAPVKGSLRNLWCIICKKEAASSKPTAPAQ